MKNLKSIIFLFLINSYLSAYTAPTGQCGLFNSVLTSYDKIVSGGNNIKVCAETVLSYPSTAVAPYIDCNPNGCGTGTCSRLDPPSNKYSITFPTLPSSQIDITTDTTFTPNLTYNGDTINGYSVFGDVRVLGNSGRTITFTPGDYYFNTLVFPDNNAKIVISGGGPVRIFVKGDLVLNKNGYEVNTAGTPNQLFIYVAGNLTLDSSGGGNGGLKAYFYVKQQTTFQGNSNWKLTGGVVSEGSIQINGNNPDFIAYSGGAGNGYGDCITSYSYQTGLFDSVDLCSAHNNSCLNTKIKTKISNKPFNLTALATNSTGTSLATLTSTVNVDSSLAVKNGSNYSILKPLSNIDFSSNSSAIDISSIINTSAVKDARILFRYCKDSSNNIYSWNGGACGVGKTDTFCLSSDNFAVRPNILDINTTDAVTINALPNLMKSGKDYNFLIKAYNYSSTSLTQDYNNSSSNLLNIITKYDKNNNISATMKGNISNGLYTITNGISNNATIAFSDVGKINISLQDQHWSDVDTLDGSTADCNGRYICGDKNLTFIPDHFDFSELNITNNNGNPGTFTYLANEINQMSGKIHTQIKALNEKGVVTENFASFPLWENPITIIPKIQTNSYLYHDANKTSITNLNLGFTAGIKTIPWNETNTSKYLRFNFKRDVNPQSIPNSFNISGTDINISAESTYLDNGKTVSIIESKNGSALGNVKFLYGRVVPRNIRIFGENKAFSANEWYEIYNTPTIGITALPVSRSESMWYINTLHNESDSGDSNITIGILPNSNTFSNGVKEFNFKGQPLGGYKEHISISPWLWYGINALSYVDPKSGDTSSACFNHPCFNINIVPAVGSTGSAKVIDGSNTKMDKTNKSTSSNTNGWHSTSDYSPSIR